MTGDDIAYFNSCSACRVNLEKSFDRFLYHYGLDTDSNNDVIMHSTEWERGSKRWFTPNRRNQNYMRFSRILQSLRELGHVLYATSFFKFLKEFHESHGRNISDETFNY